MPIRTSVFINTSNEFQNNLILHSTHLTKNPFFSFANLHQE